MEMVTLERTAHFGPMRAVATVLERALLVEKRECLEATFSSHYVPLHSKAVFVRAFC
jgi:hypothetical protein